MLEKQHYTNGQKVFELVDGTLTYFFKTGKIKAAGTYLADKMEGEWHFYRDGGQLWQVGQFKGGLKHGSCVRYDRLSRVEYEETFLDGKLTKPPVAED